MTARVRLPGACGLALILGLTGAALVAAVNGGTSAGGTPDDSGLARLTRLEAQSPTPLITSSELAAAGSGPAATVLEWWRDIQSAAPVRQVQRYYAPSAGASTPVLVAQRRVAGYFFSAYKPVVVDVSSDARQARVFALIAHGPLDATNGSAGVTPFVFDLTLTTGGQWRLADNRFLAARAQAEAVYGATHH